MKPKFIRINCKKCKNEQIIFEKASSKIDCLVCQELISLPSGGKIKIKDLQAKIIEKIE